MRPGRGELQTLLSCLLGLLIPIMSAPATAQAPPQAAWTLALTGAIGPASSDLVRRTLDEAGEAGAPLLILELDTPGGLDLSMRSLIQAILNAPVPVVTYVSPPGARAASAGTYILYASHVAAMAPATNLGAATPVQMSGSSPAPVPKGEEQEADKATPADSATAMRRKVVNDAVAYIRGLAELRGRNADWAERAVREGVSISAREALELEVIDLMAEDLEQLLARLDGRTVQVGQQERTLATAGLAVHRIEAGWRHRFLQTITNPNVAYVLMLVGLYGLLLEAYNPGMGLPGVVGGISLLIALYALQMLPISYTGLGLIGLGVALIVAEALSPTFGLLGIGGAVAFAVGSVMLMDTELPGYRIALPLVGALTLVTLVMVLGMVTLALRAHRRRRVSGVQTLVGQRATVVAAFQHRGQVRLHGEIWNAHCERPLRQGEVVTVTAVNGLLLEVEKGES